MTEVEHVVLCGGVKAARPVRKYDHALKLDLDGHDPSVSLEIVGLERRLASEVPDPVIDLVEIASYVYCADQVVTRGGEGVLAVGRDWRRRFEFHIPVRCPDIWSSHPVLHILEKTLAFLSEDEYEFRFERRNSIASLQRYMKFGEPYSDAEKTEEVLLFSGGLDSLAGAVQEAVVDRRRVALVSHRSNPKISNRQKQLVDNLRDFCEYQPLHVPVWVQRHGAAAGEYTQRSRSFLFASLGFAVARVLKLNRIRFYENGVVSLNLPISEQAVGARATRTTHPQVLNGFAELFGLLVQQQFTVENPFLWLTRTEVVNLVGDAGCGELIQYSVSCMHTHEQTADKPHCGRCSQCVGRNFATLASKYAEKDPAAIYKVDLLEGERLADKDRTLVESFIRKATDISTMNAFQVVQNYGEISRVLLHVPPLTSDQVAERVVQLHWRHARDVSAVIDEGIRRHASDIREGRLHPESAIILAVPQSYKVPNVALPPPATTLPPSGTAIGVFRSRGRKADAKANWKVAVLLEDIGKDWRYRLTEVCEALEEQKLPLFKSKKWKARKCRDWSDVLCADPEGLVKALQHRLDWVAGHPQPSSASASGEDNLSTAAHN